MNTHPSWIQAVEPQLKEAIDLPNESFSFPFSFDGLAPFLASQLGIEGLEFEMGAKGWKSDGQFFSGLGSSPISISLQATPLSGSCFWVMGYEDIKTLVSWVKDKHQNSLELDNPELIKGVYRYALLATLEGLSKTELLQPFSFKLTRDTKFEEKGYAIDIGISLNGKQIWGRILLSQTFKQSLTEFFSKDRLSFTDIAKQFPNLPIPLSIVNGSIEFTSEELQSLQEGDFVLIDNAYFRPSDEKGSLKVLIQDKPLFQVKLKEGKFKILDFLYAYEEVEANV